VDSKDQFFMLDDRCLKVHRNRQLKHWAS